MKKIMVKRGYNFCFFKGKNLNSSNLYYNNQNAIITEFLKKNNYQKPTKFKYHLIS